MIQALTIKNVALIEELTILFKDGMHVLAGETGAGKSIVVDSVNLVLGGRADKDLIRSGMEKAQVEALFDVEQGSAVYSVLSRENIDPEGRTVSLYREISRSGRNICRLCGVSVSLSILKEAADTLMDIHGQHEHTMLAKPEVQLAFLDGSGDMSHAELLTKVRSACSSFLDNHRTYSKMVKENDKNKFRFLELEKSLQELHNAKLKVGEEEQLKNEVERCRQAQKISAALKNAHLILTSGDNGNSVQSALNEASMSLKQLSSLGQDMRELANRSESLYYEIQELSFDIHNTLEKNDYDPVEAVKKEERLDLIRKLERKYGSSIPEILNVQHSMEKEYEQLSGLDDHLAEMRTEHKRLLSVYRGLARELTEKRKQLALKFENDLTRELSQLGMEHTVFHIEFIPKDSTKPTLPKFEGDDEICFMISPNPGEPLKPMEKIASGGELSRFMLAIKSLEAEHNGTGTMVFDEIDTGISGKMAQVVAEKMKKISGSRQVICVSHLPQIFAMADQRYLVAKSAEGDRTRTSVSELDREGSIAFLGRMISGTGASEESALEYAAKMIQFRKE